MAPTNFQIYVDENAPINTNPPVPVVQTGRKFVPDELLPKVRFAFDIWKHYPVDGDEISAEELLLASWYKRQQELAVKLRLEELERENTELKNLIENLESKIEDLMQKPAMSICHDSPTMKVDVGGDRLSIVPQSLQPVQEGMGMDMSVSMCKDVNNGTSVIQDLWRLTKPQNLDKFTLPIDQSQFIKDNIPTSTPSSKRQSSEEPRRNMLNQRRMSRPIMGGSPTLKLSPITETSRDGNSKSSSSSSGMSATPSTVKKIQPLNLVPNTEPDRELDPNDPTTYNRLLRTISEPLDCLPGYFRIHRALPKIKQESEFHAGADIYMVGKLLCPQAKIFTAQLLNEDSDDSVLDMKTVCFRVDEPANEWIFYVCTELHRRLAKLKISPDIELSVMMTSPALMYNDGSILIDEYHRFVTLQDYLDACSQAGRVFPKAVAAYISVELMQVVRQIHSCEIIHLNIIPKNILLTCCPTREDIENVDQRTSNVKLIGFDRALDMRLVTGNFKFNGQLNDIRCCQMIDGQPWSHEVDWFSILNCIHKMFFQEDISPIKRENGRWIVDKQFKGFPTDIWETLFDELLNIKDQETTISMIDRVTDDLNTWIKANLGFVLKEATMLDDVVEKFRKSRPA